MNDENLAPLVESLKQYEPGFLPYVLFEQIARLVTLPILEIIPLRYKEGKIQVLLLERPGDDPFWPNMLHTPGTVIRATDVSDGKQTNWPALERITNDELKNTELGVPQYVGSILHTSKRGTEQAQLYWAEVIDEPKAGSFYDVDALPVSLIDSQIAFITEAARNFKINRVQ